MHTRVLHHRTQTLTSGAFILVLDTGAVIGPEEQAMLAALYSRSNKGILAHLEALAQRGAGNFMDTYYVGYGHKSIGDNGNAIVFIEGISMLAAKAIQHFPLYNGQEGSTRYIDYSRQPFLNPLKTHEGEDILEELRTFYLEGIKTLLPHLRERFPKQEGENAQEYEKAIKARALDTMRAWLPAGATTSIAWSGELRQFADCLPVLRHHPLEEVRDLALALEDTLYEAFPHSFSKKRYPETEAYLEACSGFFNPTTEEFGMPVRMSVNNLSMAALDRWHMIAKNRPPKVELPYDIREVGTVRYEFTLDYGSFRDLERHRAVAVPMPLLSRTWGFEEWYLDELTDELREKGERLLSQLSSMVFLSEDATAQYYLPMGYRVPVRITGDLRAIAYLIELRSTRFVHPTLREKALAMEMLFRKVLRIPLHIDADPDRFDVRRGAQDIIEKNS